MMRRILAGNLLGLLTSCCAISICHPSPQPLGIGTIPPGPGVGQGHGPLGFAFFPQPEPNPPQARLQGPLRTTKRRAMIRDIKATTRTLRQSTNSDIQTIGGRIGSCRQQHVLGPKFDRAVAAIACMWWRHHNKIHRQVQAGDLVIDYDLGILGSGAFGEVYRAAVVNGEHKGTKAIVKRAKDGEQDDENPHASPDPNPESMSALELEDYIQKMDEQQQAFHYLQVEAFINDIVQSHCPSVGARYLGLCRNKGLRWLVFEDVGGDSLDSLLNQCAGAKSLKPLATALRMEEFEDGDPDSLHKLVNLIAWQLMTSCSELAKAGVAHRDMKPENLLISDGRLILIDFGAAAAMGLPEMTGYDYRCSPCDPAYVPPEDFIDETAWSEYDVFSCGLILVRVLFQPFWLSEEYLKFSDAFRAAHWDLDLWLRRIIAHDPRCKLTSRMPRWLRGLQHIVLPGAERETEPDSMDQEFLTLAQSCPLVPSRKKGLQLCFLKTGLEVLNTNEGGICWETLRQMLTKCPRKRMGSEEVLERLRISGAVPQCL